MAIKRIWHGWTTPENADAYENLLRDEIFRGIEAKNIPGYRSIELLRRDDYIGVLVPGGAKSPAFLAEDPDILAFLRKINDDEKLVASICRGSLLVAKSGIAKGRHLTGFHLDKEFPDLVIRPIVEENGGIWSDDKPVVVDANLVSSRHPNDIEYFTEGIRQWLSKRSRTAASGHSE